MEHIDIVLADDLTTGDLIELWDSEDERYVYETVTRVETDGITSVIVYTEENNDEGWWFQWDHQITLCSY